MSFFDPTDADDLKLLHSEIRAHDELENVAAKVEWEVIDAFSQREGQSLGNHSAFFDYESGVDPTAEIEVRLIGYDSDDPDNSEAGLKEALRRTIADIISWVLRDYSNTQNVRSIRQGARSVTYSGVPSWQDWQDGWKLKLRNYDATIPQYAI